MKFKERKFFKSIVPRKKHFCCLFPVYRYVHVCLHPKLPFAGVIAFFSSSFFIETDNLFFQRSYCQVRCLSYLISLEYKGNMQNYNWIVQSLTNCNVWLQQIQSCDDLRWSRTKDFYGWLILIFFYYLNPKIQFETNYSKNFAGESVLYLLGMTNLNLLERFCIVVVSFSPSYYKSLELL